MKWLLAIFLLIASLLWADENPQTPAAAPTQLQIMQPDTVQEDLLGHVNSVDEKEYRGTDASGLCTARHYERFNSSGCILENSRYMGDQVLKEQEVSIYDSQGNLIQRKTLKNRSTLISNFIFDVPTFTISKLTRTDDILVERSVATYDNFGKEHEIIDYDAADQIKKRYTTTRNQDGKETLVDFYDKDNLETEEIALEWNPDGSKATETISSLQNGIITHVTKTDFTYLTHDTAGNWTSCIESSSYERNDQPAGESSLYLEREITYY